MTPRKERTKVSYLAPRQWTVFLTLVGIFLLLGGVGVIVGNQGAKNPIRAATAQATQRLAVASVSPLNSGSSSWYCNWYLPGEGGISRASVLLANTSPKDLSATINIYSKRDTITKKIKIPAHSFLRYPEQVSPSVQSGSLSFVADGGGTLAEIELVGSLGTAIEPCNSSPSANWAVLGSNTLSGSTTGISIFNPFAQDAVADISMSSTTQQFKPGPLQGLLISAHSSVTINLSQYFPGQAHVSVAVSTRIGRVVLGGLVQRNDKGTVGLAALSASPAPASLWRFPVGELSDNQNQELIVYNPNSHDVTIDAQFSYLDLKAVRGPVGTTTTIHPSVKQGKQAAPSSSTFSTSEVIPPFSVRVISVKSDTAVQLGLSYQTVLTVAGGKGVVAAEAFIGSKGSPNLRYQVVGGIPLVTRYWIALYDPSALGVPNAQAWLATVDTGRTTPVSDKTPLIDLGPTYLAGPGKVAAALPTGQALVAKSSTSVLNAPSHLNPLGKLAPAVTGIIVSSSTPFALGTVMGISPSDLYVVPVLPFAN